MAPPCDTVPTQGVDGIQAGLYIVMAEAFLYGAYTVMFGFYVHILYTRRIPKNRFLSVATISLFMLCTVHLALLLAGTVVLDQRNNLGDPSYLGFQLNFAVNLVYVTSSVIADSIFIFRCYAIWDFDHRIIFLPVLSTIGVGILGYFDSSRSIVVSRGVFNSAIATSVFTTLLLMGLSGRIWWLALKAREVLGRKITTKYNTACVMILESGALYCVGGIVYIILAFHQPNDQQPIASAFARTNGAILGQLVGIAPTIIAVRVGLGKAVNNADSFEATQQRCVEAPRAIQPVVAPAHSIEGQILYLRRNTESDDTTKPELV
ncbi:hypothetical protein K438DRAFT_1989251 [Mycena galopus ATCC 62051]|nr:hypothetical protein K438DRAFT_1989251 [Mycena galopus ATCC 62051]